MSDHRKNLVDRQQDNQRCRSPLPQRARSGGLDVTADPQDASADDQRLHDDRQARDEGRDGKHGCRIGHVPQPQDDQHAGSDQQGPHHVTWHDGQHEPAKASRHTDEVQFQCRERHPDEQHGDRDQVEGIDLVGEDTQHQQAKQADQYRAQDNGPEPGDQEALHPRVLVTERVARDEADAGIGKPERKPRFAEGRSARSTG